MNFALPLVFLPGVPYNSYSEKRPYSHKQRLKFMLLYLRTRSGGNNGGGVTTGGNGDGDDDFSPGHPSRGHIGVLGMLFFVASEFVFFAALAIAFLAARAGRPDWPPPGQPRLPLLISGFNTALLLLSGYTMLRALQSIRKGERRNMIIWLAATAMLGGIFLGIQGIEWVRLVQFGLTMANNLYGAMFYLLIGTHALHVLAAVLAILYVWRRARAGAYAANRHSGVVICGIFWLFVVLIWPALYVTVYLI